MVVLFGYKMANPNLITPVCRLDDLYQDSSLYSTPEMFSPPSERRPHVIRFELMVVCSYQNCTYCEGYQGVPFMNKSLDEYVSHVDTVWEKIGSNTELAKRLQRIFIGGGDALGVKTKTLQKAVRYTWKEFHKHTGNLPRRISVYGRTHSILKQGAENLTALKVRSGLNLIYWGVESGSTEVLKYVRKGCTQEDLLRAADCLYSAEMLTSIMIMPGLGGIKYSEQHITETAKVIGAIKPAYITFMGVNPSSRSAYFKRMEEEVKEGTNRPLTDLEMAKQIKEMISLMPAFYTHLGCHNSFVDAVGHNPAPFGSRPVYAQTYPPETTHGIAGSLLDGHIWRLERLERMKDDPEKVIRELEELSRVCDRHDLMMSVGITAMAVGLTGLLCTAAALPEILIQGFTETLAQRGTLLGYTPPFLLGLGALGTILTHPFENSDMRFENRMKIMTLEGIIESARH